jgi:hypothetical protein
MAVEADIYLTRSLQRDILRRYVDATRLDVSCMHGVVYIRGYLRKLRSHPEINLSEEVEVIKKLLRHHDGVREIIWEAETQGN